MIRNILSATDPKLRLKSQPVQKIDKKTLGLVKDLKDTLKVQVDPEGVGLAAPQIGKNLRLFVMKRQDGTIKTVINPTNLKIIQKNIKNKNKIMEGCLSLPNYYGPLARDLAVQITFLTESGKTVTETFNDFDSQIVLHEIDHLEGVLFVDRLLEQKKPLYELVGDEWHEVEL